VASAESITVLGVDYSAHGNCLNHPAQRISACRRAIYSFADRGALYHGLCTEAKVHLWRTIGLPSLTYGQESVHYPLPCSAEVEATQSTLLKRCLGLPNRSHHSHLLNALGIRRVTYCMCSISNWLILEFYHFEGDAPTPFAIRGSSAKQILAGMLFLLSLVGFGRLSFSSDFMQSVTRSLHAQDARLQRIERATWSTWC